MSIGPLIITHGDIWSSLLEAAARILGTCPRKMESIPVTDTVRPYWLSKKARKRLKKVDDGGGALILTDIFGSNPGNVARPQSDGRKAGMISGVNPPMLARIMNYPGLSMAGLMVKAITGGRDGVFSTQESNNV